MYTYEKFNVRLMPWFLLLLGIVFTLTGQYIEAAIFGTPGGLFAISFKGFKIDAVNKRIRHYDRFLWFYFGRWQYYPEPMYVTVVSIKLGAKRNAPIAFVVPEGGKASQAYKMNLVVDGKQRYIALTRGSRSKLIEEAMKIGELLDIRVLDYTCHDKKWL
ncbi:MAG: hypothetical protein R3356_05145, partial [Eudoraea sp.]|nr:hypothetical protein [Eudoraea sp.]